jgi:sulfatase maturation enzyme AslB (radical SAM superfamily)
MATTHLSKSGLFFREEKSLGLLTYSPYTGLIYACHKDDSALVISWLNKKSNNPPKEYLKALGVGWAIDYTKANFPIPHLLSRESSQWPLLPLPSAPILINWLISGICPLKCIYCYAEDLMRGRVAEPKNHESVKLIAKTILTYNPLAVVITGGDPISSPFFETALQSLYGHTGIIVDTSAYNLSSSQVDLFRKFNVFVRISLDSELKNVNDSLRIVMGSKQQSSLIKALDGIKMCLNEGVNFSVQTVVTRKNYNDLESLGDKLSKIGVRGWRLLLAAPSSMNVKVYKSIVGDRKNLRRLSDYILTNLFSLYNTYWKPTMTFQVVKSEATNSVVLVGPDGKFYTESNIPHKGKVLLDNSKQRHPSLSSIFSKVNIHLHTERYLNIIRNNAENLQ